LCGKVREIANSSPRTEVSGNPVRRNPLSVKPIPLCGTGRGVSMGIRTGQEYRESLRDGRTIYVNGTRVSDVTAYPPFRGVIDTIAGRYDLQHDPAHQALLTYPSPTTSEPVSLSFLLAETIEEVERRCRAEEFRAEATFGLMGRLPDFMNALVTDAAAA